MKEVLGVIMARDKRFALAVRLVWLTWTMLVPVAGHGRLMDPPARNSMWRLGFTNPVNYNDNELYCGGRMVQWLRNGGKCGVCGDPYHGPRDHEAGGKYANGIITRTYRQGDTIPITVHLTANHQGWFEIRICPVNNIKATVSQECLDQHVLPLAHGEGNQYPVPKGKYNAFFNYTVQLPPTLTCTQCVLQWKYHTANTWDKDDISEAFCLGCGPQEEFYNCADIQILSDKVTKTKMERKSDTEERPLSATKSPVNNTGKKDKEILETKRQSEILTNAPSVYDTTVSRSSAFAKTNRDFVKGNASDNKTKPRSDTYRWRANSPLRWTKASFSTSQAGIYSPSSYKTTTELPQAALPRWLVKTEDKRLDSFYLPKRSKKPIGNTLPITAVSLKLKDDEQMYEQTTKKVFTVQSDSHKMQSDEVEIKNQKLKQLPNHLQGSQQKELANFPPRLTTDDNQSTTVLATTSSCTIAPSQATDRPADVMQNSQLLRTLGVLQQREGSHSNQEARTSGNSPQAGTGAFTLLNPYKSVLVARSPWQKDYGDIVWSQPMSTRKGTMGSLQCRATVSLGGGMDEWCTANCNANYCPSSMCICQSRLHSVLKPSKLLPTVPPVPVIETYQQPNPYTRMPSLVHKPSQYNAMHSHQPSQNHAVYSHQTKSPFSSFVANQRPVKDASRVFQSKTVQSSNDSDNYRRLSDSDNYRRLKYRWRDGSINGRGLICTATGYYAGLPEYDVWCSNNCAQAMCPLLMCTCQQIF